MRSKAWLGAHAEVTKNIIFFQWVQNLGTCDNTKAFTCSVLRARACVYVCVCACECMCVHACTYKGACATAEYLSFGPMAQCVVHALEGLACRAPVLLAHAEVTENIKYISMGPKLRYPEVQTFPVAHAL